MHLDIRIVKTFQNKILNWYSEHKRDLPWRRTRDPYKILVSEVMLQQTQVSRVIPKYEAWLQRFPTVQDLAKATNSDVLQYWSGLGYNRRALYLKRTAEAIVNEFKGVWPKDLKALQTLPGIGKYTAAAIACFAFDQQVAVVDINVKKVILTQLCHPEHFDKLSVNFSEGSHELILKDSSPGAHRDQNDKKLTEKEIEAIAQYLLPVGKAYEWNQALMDYSSLVLKNISVQSRPKDDLGQRPISLGLKPLADKFVGSNRYYRGKIIKMLLQKKEIPIAVLGKELKNDYTAADEVWLLSLLNQLVKDGMIIFTDKRITLA